jgi:hypothetical protein
MFLALATLETNAQVRQPSLEQRQVALRSVKREPRKRPEFNEADWQRTAQDFKSLQVESSRLSELISVTPVPDYTLIKTTAGRVKKRAQRLRELLGFPQPKKETQVERSEVSNFHDLRRLTDRLMTRVDAFVSNPVFERLRVFDVNEAERASADIAAVIRISQDVRKAADVMRRLQNEDRTTQIHKTH